MSAITIIKKFFPKVRKVIDATKPADIEVLQVDANSKAVKQHHACAMAVACKRKFKLDGVIIARSVAYLVKGTQARRFTLPESVKREVVSFDRGAGFDPGKYQLVPPEPSQRLDAPKRPTNRPRGDRGSKPKRFRHITKNIRHVLGGGKKNTD